MSQDSSSEEPRRAAWARIAPRAELAVALEELELSELDEFDLVDAITACERQIAHLRAVQARAVQQLSTREDYAFCEVCDEREPADHFHEHDRIAVTGRETGTALTLSPNQGTNHAAVCIGLVERHRRTLAALDDGRIGLGKARVIVEGIRWLDDPWLQAEVEDRLLDVAPGMTERQLKRRLHRMVMAADPETVRKRHADGRRRRRVCRPVADDEVAGIAGMTLVGPAEDLAALYTAVDAAARAMRTGGDQRTLDQLRFDALCGLGWAALSTGVLGGTCTRNAPGGVNHNGGHSPGASSEDADGHGGDAAGSGACHPGCGCVRLARRHGRPAMVHVTMPITALLGLDDAPCELAGYGPIPAEAARRIATDAVFHRMLTDPADGRLLEYGRTTYTPPQELVDFIQARDTRCVFPTCDAPSAVCDIDHRIPYRESGTTGKSNNQPLSRGCHVDKTLHGWTIEHPPDGSYRWRSPAGHSYMVPPEAVGPIQTLAHQQRIRTSNPDTDPAPF